MLLRKLLLLVILVVGTFGTGVSVASNPVDVGRVQVHSLYRNIPLGQLGFGSGPFGALSGGNPWGPDDCPAFTTYMVIERDAAECVPQSDACQFYKDSKPANCDLNNPPPRRVDGCGSGVTAGVVPDQLIVNGLPASSLGNIFTDACNAHDDCYAADYPNEPGSLVGKEECDIKLGQQMLNDARIKIPSEQWAYYESHVIVQAAAYSLALQNQPTATFANSAFRNAREEGSCRWHAAFKKYHRCP